MLFRSAYTFSAGRSFLLFCQYLVEHFKIWHLRGKIAVLKFHLAFFSDPDISTIVAFFLPTSFVFFFNFRYRLLLLLTVLSAVGEFFFFLMKLQVKVYQIMSFSSSFIPTGLDTL